MIQKDFDLVLATQMRRIEQTLGAKSAEYASDADKLHNFKQAANLEKITQAQALGGMMAKHTVSIYDMIGSGATYSLEQWDEKITDHVNYLILLRAIVVEEMWDIVKEESA